MSLIPPRFLNCVVAIGVRNNDGEIRWGATGTLFGSFQEVIEETKESSRRRYGTYLVTNRHVLKSRDEIVIGFFTSSGRPVEYEIVLINEDGEKEWVGHPNGDIDVAVTGIHAETLNRIEAEYDYFRSDTDVHRVNYLNKISVTEGDGIFILGYPMGIVGEEEHYAICRDGCIARIRDVLAGYEIEFLVDGFVFPGNSGGPVILKPEAISIEGTSGNPEAGLIGIVSSYVPYQEEAVSRQTGKLRAVFQENSGLALVIPTDRILETIEEFQQSDVSDE